MDLQKYLDTIVKNQREERLSQSDQLTLGDLIKKIEVIASRQDEMIKKYEHEADVVFDFEYLFPTYIDSWRGSYDELALGFSDHRNGKPMPVSKFLEMLKECYEKEFTGYKGGEYRMSDRTPIWVANYGNAGSTALVEVVDNEYQVILITGLREY